MTQKRPENCQTWSTGTQNVADAETRVKRQHSTTHRFFFRPFTVHTRRPETHKMRTGRPLSISSLKQHRSVELKRVIVKSTVDFFKSKMRKFTRCLSHAISKHVATLSNTVTMQLNLSVTNAHTLTSAFLFELSGTYVSPLTSTYFGFIPYLDYITGIQEKMINTRTNFKCAKNQASYI